MLQFDMKSTTTTTTPSIKTCLAFLAGIFCFCLVQAQQPQGIGKPAPLNPPAVVAVQTPAPYVATEVEKANAAKSMEEYNRTQAGGQLPRETSTERIPQPNDATDPRQSNPKE